MYATEKTRRGEISLLTTLCLSAIRNCCRYGGEDDNDDSSILVPVNLYSLVPNLLDSKADSFVWCWLKSNGAYLSTAILNIFIKFQKQPLWMYINICAIWCIRLRFLLFAIWFGLRTTD